MNDEVIDRLRRLVIAVRDSHGGNRLLLPALTDARVEQAGPDDASTTTVRFEAAMTGLIPIGLAGLLPFDLPRELDSAARTLHGLGVREDPRRIDLHQVGVRICRTFEVEPDDYCRSARAKRRIPAPVRMIVERCFGTDGRAAYHRAEELERDVAQLKTAAGPENRPGSDPSDTPVASPDQPTPLQPSPGRTAGSPSLAVPCRLGPFELEKLVGRGGMGDVYRGYDRSLRRVVAVKVLPDDLARRPEALARFQAEAASIARLSPPHVIPIYHVGHDAGRHFFVMPFLEGESLAERLVRSGRIPVAEAVAIGIDVLSGLQAAHEQGLVHRDIKPGNVLLDRETGRAVVADFGLVKSLAGSGVRTASGIIIGTVDYMSPEQGRGAAVDLRSDLYSTGVMLYQLLAGRLPFQAESPTAMIFQHVYERPVPIISVVSDVPYPLWTIVARLLAKRPSHRYQGAAQVLEDLHAFREGRRLPLGTDRLDLEPLWLPAAKSESSGAETRIVTALPDAEAITDPGTMTDGEAAAVPGRRGWWRRWWKPSRPLAASATEQQVEDAVADCRVKRDQIGALVREAEEVLSELRSADSSESESMARLVAAQEEQLATMRLQLAKIEANLQTLGHQRDLLNARLAVALIGSRRGVRPTAWPLILTAGSIAIAAAVVVRVATAPPRPKASPGQENLRNALAASAGHSPQQPVPVATGYAPQFAIGPSGQIAVVGVGPPPFNQGKASIRVARMTVVDLAGRAAPVELTAPHSSQALVISPGGDFVASAGENLATRKPDLRIWSLASRELVGTYSIEVPRLRSSLAFSRDGKTLFVVNGPVDGFSTTTEAVLKSIDVATGEIREIPRSWSQAPPSSIGASTTEDLLIIGVTGRRAAADLFDLKRSAIRASIPVPTTQIAVSADGTILALAPDSQSVRLFETATQKQVAEFEARNRIDRIRISPKGDRVAWDHNGSIAIATRKPTTEIQKEPGRVLPRATASAFDFDRESNLWAVGGDGIPVRLDDVTW